MTTEGPKKSYVADGEKVTAVMIYTQNLFIWGNVATKEAIRVSTWLRSSSAPRYIYLHEARVITFGSGNAPRQQAFEELLIPTLQVMAFHIKPPAQDPLDFDPKETMRKMEPVTAVVGNFTLDGFVRMSTQTTLDRYLDVAKEAFTGIYDVDIHQPSQPNTGVMRVPYVLVRSEGVIFSTRNA